MACGNCKKDDNKKNVVVNDNCIGCGACVAICNEVFDLSDEGKAYVKSGADLNCDCIDDAIGACPVEAIEKK